jgi:hypothetical protein
MDAHSTLTKPARKAAAVAVAVEAPAAGAVVDPVVAAGAVVEAAAVVDRGSEESPAGKRRKERPVW